MFEVNLLNKKGLQHTDVEVVTIIDEPNDKLENSFDNRLEQTKYYYIIVLIILSLFFYIFYFNQINHKINYHNISPVNILLSLEANSTDNKILSIETNSKYFKIVKEITHMSDIYHEQIYFDSLFNIDTYISIDNDIETLYLNFNWYIEKKESWNTEKLYNKLNLENTLTSRIELFNNKIISVANYNELINFFNILKKLDVDHIFDYKVELFNQRINSKIDYYKIVISSND